MVSRFLHLMAQTTMYLFGVSLILQPNLGGHIAKNKQFFCVNRVIAPNIETYYRNYWRIITKFCTVIETTVTLRGWCKCVPKQIWDDGRPPSWWKIATSLQQTNLFWRNLERWCTSALQMPSGNKILRYPKSKMSAATTCKNWKIVLYLYKDLTDIDEICHGDTSQPSRCHEQ